MFIIMSSVDGDPPRHQVLHRNTTSSKRASLQIRIEFPCAEGLLWIFSHPHILLCFLFYLTASPLEVSYNLSGGKLPGEKPGPLSITFIGWIQVYRKACGDKSLQSTRLSHLYTIIFCYNAICYHFKSLSVKMCKLCIKIICWKT